MDLHLISDIDLEKLEEELNGERLSFKDVANYITGLKIDETFEQVGGVFIKVYFNTIAIN